MITSMTDVHNYAKAKKGFSLAQAVVVIALMAVLMSFLTPSLISLLQRNKARIDDNQMQAFADTVERELADNEVKADLLKTFADTDELTIEFEFSGKDINLLQGVIKSGEKQINFEETVLGCNCVMSYGNTINLNQTRIASGILTLTTEGRASGVAVVVTYVFNIENE